MDKKEEILSEIDWLIEQQMQKLKGPVGQDIAYEYGQRSKRIQELLGLIGILPTIS